MMLEARYKPMARRPSKSQYRILCGKLDAQGNASCRGELGRLFVKAESARNGLWVSFTPLVSSAMAQDAQGWWRETRQRRPFISGIDGGRNVGGGVRTDNLLRDAAGRPLKWLPPLFDVAGKDRVTMVCPHCQAANEVLWTDIFRTM